jgi:hypothetical protein
MRFILLCLVGSAFAADQAMNPIRRIVNILQKMQEEMRHEGERDEELHEKFMCFCKKGAGKINKEINDQIAEAKAQAAAAKEAAAKLEQLKNDLKQAKSDRADAQGAIKEAEAMRNKEAEEFASKSGDQKQNLDALGRAITAIEKGMGKMFLQTRANSEQLKRVVMSSMSVDQQEKETVLSFLASPYGDYQAASGEIVGILKAMNDEMSKDYKQMLEDEKNAKANFDQLVAAKNKEIEAATKSIEEKSVRQGEVAVAATEGKNNAANAEAEAEENKKFLADLEKNCGTAEKDFAERQKTRNEEILAVAEAIKILNDDDALDIFKKTLPSPETPAPSLIQIEAPRHIQAYAILKATAQMVPDSSKLELLAYSLKTGKVDFSKITKMIDEMIVHLGNEQKADEDHKNYCNDEADKNADTKRTLERDIKDKTAEIDSLDNQMETLKAEMKALEENSADTEKAMEEATVQRKAENAEFTKEQTELGAAKMILGKAKNRLLKFYNPALYKPPPQRELTEEERIAQNMGEVIPEGPPEMIPGTNIPKNLIQEQKVDIGEAPKQGSYKKKSGKSQGVIGLMDMLDKDLDTQIQEGKHEEKIAQRDYEELMAQAKATLESNRKSLTTKQGEHATARDDHQKATEMRNEFNDQLMSTNELIAALHGECDFLLKNFDFRKEARTKEIEGLKNAKAVLAGANYE